MSKTNDPILLLPGESGWEAWARQADGTFALERSSEVSLAGDISELPAGEITLLFPARAVTALPMRVQTGDPALYADLVLLQGERMGLRPDPLAGKLVDYFPVERDDERSTLLAVFLKSPVAGELPARSPVGFDVLARCFRVEGNAICLWRELGRWVFAVFDHGRLLFFQATAVDAAVPDEALAREIQLSLMQLSMQGLSLRPARIELWTSATSVDPAGLKAVFDLPVQVLGRPQPVLPDPVSRLLPEDVRAARDLARRRQWIRLGVAGAAALYLLIAGWLAFGIWKKSSDAAELERLAREAAPEGEAYALHMKKWLELADAIDRDHSPVEVLLQIQNCLPPQGGVRLELAEVSANNILLRGSAPESQLQAISRFSINLTKHSGLSRYQWEVPEANQGTAGWKFEYRGTVPAADSQP